VATPISNNNPVSIVNNKSSASGGRANQAQGRPDSQVEQVTAKQNEDAVSVSRAAEVLSQAAVDRGQGTIQSSEQALELAGQLKDLLLNNPARALAGQAGSVSSSIMDLLKAG